MSPPSGPPRGGGTHAGKAALVIAVVVVLGWIVLHHGPNARLAPSAASTSRTTTAATLAPSTTSTTIVPPASIKLQVLNGTGSGNLATQWSNKLRSSPGYDTLAPDNATAKVSQSEIFVLTPGYLPEAYALATTVGLSPSAVNTTIPAPASAPIPTSERSKANLVLVIGPDLVSGA